MLSERRRLEDLGEEEFTAYIGENTAVILAWREMVSRIADKYRIDRDEAVVYCAGAIATATLNGTFKKFKMDDFIANKEGWLC